MSNKTKQWQSAKVPPQFPLKLARRMQHIVRTKLVSQLSLGEGWNRKDHSREPSQVLQPDGSFHGVKKQKPRLGKIPVYGNQKQGKKASERNKLLISLPISPFFIKMGTITVPPPRRWRGLDGIMGTMALAGMGLRKDGLFLCAVQVHDRWPCFSPRQDAQGPRVLLCLCMALSLQL